MLLSNIVMQSFTSTPSVALHPPATRNPHGKPTNEDWEHHRAIFEQLYSAECRSLKEVKEFMERDYGFFATYVFNLFLTSSHHHPFQHQKGRVRLTSA